MHAPRIPDDPYVPPATMLAPEPADPGDSAERIRERDFTGDGRLALQAFWLSLVPIAGAPLAFAVAMLFQSITPGTVVMGAASLVAAIGVVAGLRAAIGLAKIDPALRTGGLALAVISIPIGMATSILGALITFMSMVTVSRGRQLRSLTRVELARIDDDSAWVPPAQTGEPAAGEPEVADAWRKNGLTEHASVAAFAKLSMELVALGAPPSLIEAAHKDALDEMRHTELCFSLARALDGRRSGPGAFPAAAGARLPSIGPKSVRLARLAVESLIDGALNEGISARVVAELSREVSDPRVRPVLETIARDEGRHAAHGFDLVRWCVAEGGYPVRAALAGALTILPAKLGKALSPLAEDGRFESLGIPGRVREARAFEVVRARLVSRTERLIYGSVYGRSTSREMPLPESIKMS